MIAVGDHVWLKSGSARLLVVDVAGDKVTVAWKRDNGVVVEHEFPRACFTKKKTEVKK